MIVWRSSLNFLRRSLARKLVAAFLLVYLVLTGALMWELAIGQNYTIMEQRSERARGVATMLAASGKSSVLSQDRAGLQELIVTAAGMPRQRASFFTDAKGLVLAHSNIEKVGLYLTPLPKLSAATAGQSRIWSATNDQLIATAPVVMDGRLLGYAWTAIDVQDVRAALWSHVLDALLLGVFAITMGLLAALTVAHGVTKRIAQLAHVAHRFSKGERDLRVPVKGIDEVATASSGFNQMLDAVAKSEASLREVQHVAALGSWTYDPESPTLEWTEEVYKMFGLDPLGPPPSFEQFLGMLPEAQQHDILELVENTQDEVKSFILNYTTPGGEERACWAEARAIVNAQGKRVLTGICQDVTEREAAAAQLRQAQRMEAVGQLTGGLAHDFNNLLAIAVGNLDLANEALPADSEAKEAIEEALGAVLRGAKLTKQLLAFSRRQALSPTAVDLNELIVGFEPLWRRTVGAEIEVRTNLASDLWTAKVDPAQVESAILNLVINARDAMSDGGKLIVETQNIRLTSEASETVFAEIEPGSYAVISVSDTGHGMSRETLERACEPFFTTKGVGQGSGLGLSMIKGFAEQSGGYLKIYSEVGLGTTMRLFLPVAHAPAAQSKGSVPARMPSSSGETILLVEDDEGVRRLAERQLDELGYKVISAEDGPQALIALEETRVDLLFTDIAMPGGMTGLELAERAEARFPNLRVLYTSGFSQAAIVGLGDGAVLLNKPYRKSELAVYLRKVLEEEPPIPRAA